MKTFTPKGPLKYIVDFKPHESIYSEKHGHCFKANSVDGLVIINVKTGKRIEVASTEMFFAAELV